MEGRAEAGGQAWGSLTGIQQGGSRKAGGAFHSPLRAAQILERKKWRVLDELGQRSRVSIHLGQKKK